MEGDAAKANIYVFQIRKRMLRSESLFWKATSIKNLGAALDAKFPGGAGTQAVANFRKVLAGLPRLINVNGDTATITAHAGDPNPDTMKKVDGGWKIVPSPAAAGDAAKLAGMKNMTTLFEGLAGDVNAGKYATVAAYQQDAGQKLAALFAASQGTTDAAGPPTTAPAPDGAAPPATAPSTDTTTPPPTTAPSTDTTPPPPATAPNTETPAVPPAVPPVVPPATPPKKKPVRD